MARRTRPPLHGDDHANGVDPIPGFGGITRWSGVYSGNAVTIADNSSDNLTFDHFLGGDSVLDISNPTFPQVTQTGNWIFGVDVFCSTDLTAGGQFQVELDVIGLGHGTSVGSANYFTTPAATTRIPRPRATVWGSGWMDSTSATTKISLLVTNEDTASSLAFSVNKLFAAFLGGP